MKIGIISDTHGGYRHFENALKYLKDCDHVIHCGDTLYGGSEDEKIKLAEALKMLPNLNIVMGNCDSLSDLTLIGKNYFHTPYMILNLGKYNFFVTHGHHYSYLNLFYKAKELDCNIICYGHTHIKDINLKEGIQIINPGSVSKPRDASHSIVIIEDDKIKVIDIKNNTIIYESKIFNEI